MLQWSVPTPSLVWAFATALPWEDEVGKRPEMIMEAVQKSVSATLLENYKPIVMLGVFETGRAWMHSVPEFHRPHAAFRAMRKWFAKEAEARGEIIVSVTGKRVAKVVRALGFEHVETEGMVSHFRMKGRRNVLG